METGKIKKQIDPSNPVNLDSGQQEELTYIIESLKRNIHIPKREGQEGKEPANDDGGRQRVSLISWPAAAERHVIVADGNLLAVAERVFA